jgi:hypothetical protein
LRVVDDEVEPGVAGTLHPDQAVNGFAPSKSFFSRLAHRADSVGNFYTSVRNGNGNTS